MRRERLRLVMLVLLIALSSAIVLWSPLFGQGATDTEPPTAPTDLQYTSPPTDSTPSFASTASTDNVSVAGTYAPTIGQFQAPSTVYANKYFYLNTTINDADGVADFVNATININGTIVLKWDNATDTFSEQSDSNNYCTLDASGSVKTSINSTAYKLSWKIKLYWNYTEGSIFVLSTNTKVYDSAGNSGSGAETSLFTFEDDLIIHSDAAVDDSRVNPSDTVTFTASIFYEGTTTAPEDVTGITAYVELNGVQKGSDTDITGGLSITITAESLVGSYSYNIYATTDQNTVQNRTVNVIVDRLKIILKGANDTRDNVDDTVRVYFNVTREYDTILFDGTKGTVYINGTAATWDGTNKYWYLDVSQSSVGAWVYQVSSITDTEYGITALNDVAGVQQVIWDRVKVYYFQVNDTRVDINSYVNVTAEALLEYDNHPLGSGDSLSFNSTSFVWNGNLFTNNTLTKSTVGNWTLVIDVANEATYGITAYTTNITNPWVVWDKVQVTLSISDNRINVGDTADITKSAVYEYDSTSFTGTINLNDTETKSIVGKYGYKTSNVSDPTYGLTVFTTNEVYCIFDRVNINSFTVSDNRINVGDSASFTVGGIYEYDSTIWAGSYSLNDTISKSTVGKYGYEISSITDTNYGLTVFSQTAADVYVIFDRIDIITYSSDDSRRDINTEATFYMTLQYEYDSSAVTDGTATLNGSLFLTWSATNSRWEYKVTKSSVQKLTVYLASVSENTYGITALNPNVSNKTISVIWDRMKIINGDVLDNRIDYGTTGTIWFNVTWEYDNTLFEGGNGTVYVNGTACTWGSSNVRWEVSFTYSTVANHTFTVSSITDNVYGISVLNDVAGAKWIVWDRIKIADGGVSDGRCDYGSTQTVWFQAQYEYDSVTFDSGKGTLYVNGTAMTWSSGNSRWEKTYSYSAVIKYDFKVSSVSDGAYGLTVINDIAGAKSIIWDRVVVTISADSTGPDAGQTVNFTVTAVYDYDDVSVTSWTVNIYRNSTHFATGNFTDKSDSEVKYLYTTENVTDNMYDLTAFTSNTVTVVWGNLFIEVNEINVQDSRINIGTQATVYYHCRFSSNQSSCTTGTLYVNGTNFTINSTGWATVTFTFSEVCKKALVVTVINVNGETDFQQGPSNPEIIWDRVNVTISADGTYVVLNTQVNFTVTAIYEFDSNPVTSWTVNIYRNSTHFATGNFTDTQASSSVYEYTTENITEGTFGLTGFQSNTVIVEWYNSPPVASFTYSPEFPIAGETVTFNASTSYDLDGTIDVYKWDFGDGTAIEASPTPTMTHIYEMRGNYTVTLTVIDDEGSENKTEATITVIDYPTADFNYSPTYPLAGETVTFNASTSAPNGGTIVSYFWNFGDGTTANVTSAIITHTYSSFGNYTVTLTVKDSEGLTNSCSKVICIIDYPTADFTYSPTYPIAGEAVNFDASTSTPNGGTVISYFWDFGDGTNATGLIVSHVYHALGSYPVTLKISDSEGLSDSASKLINVRQQPTANFTYSPTLPMIGETVTFNASSSTPNGGSIVTYAWDFGDAQTGTGVIANHTYLTYGICNVTLTVTDSEGLSDSLTQTIRILIGPTANFTHSPKYPVINQTVEFDGSLSHDPDGAIFEYTWDFGDGNITTVQNPLIEHAYQETDTYLVTLTVKDSDGLSNSITKHVIVYSVLPPPDIAVLNVQTAYSQVYQGYTLIIKVTVFNEGYSTETFNVTAYANNTIIETLTVSNLPPDEQMILTFRWDTNGFAEYQNYTISAHAHPVPREIDIADNSFVDGVVRLVHIGDVNNDGQVRVDDILAIALAFGSNVGDSRYDPALDITCDGKIRIDDVLAAVLNFGWTKP